MTDPIHPIPSPAPGGPAPRAGTSRPVLLVIGVVMALIGLPLLLAGLGLGWGLATQRDDDGFFATPTERFSTETVALSSPVLELGQAGPDDWWAGRDLATVRLTATSADSPVFVGIGPSRDVERYLAPTAHDEISDVRTDPFDYSLTRRGSGEDLPTPPTEHTFWTAQATGAGPQTLEWDLAPGRYTAVVMNPDGSSGVTIDLTAAGRVDMLVPIAWTCGVTGVLLILGGALLIAYGAPRSTASGAPRPTDAVVGVESRLVASASGAVPSPVTLTGRQDPTLSRWLWLVKWLLALPHFLVLAVLWLVFLVITVVAFVAILVTGRYPRALFEFNVGVLRWTWRVQFYATNVIGTDRYPPFTLDHADYPADLDIAYPETLSRGLVLVKSWLLALPHLLVLAVLAGTWRIGDADGARLVVGGLIGALTLAAGLLLLFAGRYPAPLFDLLVGLNRWAYRVIAYVALMTDTYPPFRLDQGPTEPTSPTPPRSPLETTGTEARLPG